MYLLEKTTAYFLPTYLQGNPLHPEYEDRYMVLRTQIAGCITMFVMSFVFYKMRLFIAPFILINTLSMTACLLFSRSGYLQQANIINASLLYFLYFPAMLHTGGIYSLYLVAYYVILTANMFTHPKWGVYFLIPALLSVWLLYFFTPDSATAASLWGSRVYAAVCHTMALSLLVASFATSYKKVSSQVIESKAAQNNKITVLNDEVSRRTKELTNMRQTLAADFHDETGNMLSAITRQAALLKIKLAFDPHVMNIVDHIIANSNQLYASSRHFIWNLNNDSDDPQVLFHYLTSFGQVFYNQFDISFSAENRVTDCSSVRLESFAAINLIFIFKEAMNNVIKHAEAKEVVLKMTQKEKHLYFSLTDDGTWKEKDESRTHHGLTNMEKRCEQNGFSFSINHLPRIGTRVEIGVPAIVTQTLQTAVV